MRRFLVFCVLGLAGLVVFPTVAFAATKSGVEHFRLTSVNNRPGALLAQGVLTASGKDYPEPDKDLAVFPGGAFTIDHSGSATVTVNPKTCLATISLSGLYRLEDGYGKFKGIQGFGIYRGTTTGVVPRAADGTCSHRQPFSTVTTVSAIGPLAF